jgi:two-component system, sensor histidine kinase and response regulator
VQQRSPGAWYFVLDEPARILVADDDPIFREFASVHISSPAAEVITAVDGAQAWQKLSSEAFDLALVDLEMPQIDGFDLTHRIRNHGDLRHLPIVVVTGHEDIASIDKAYALGATSFVAKPVNWRLLSHQLKYVLRMHRVGLDTRDRSQRISELKSDMLTRLAKEVERAAQVIRDAAEHALHSSSSTLLHDQRQNLECIGDTARRVQIRVRQAMSDAVALCEAKHAG